MKISIEFLKRFVREEDAPTMAEYGLLLVFIALVAAVGAGALGVGLDNVFQNSGTAVNNATPVPVITPGTP